MFGGWNKFAIIFALVALCASFDLHAQAIAASPSGTAVTGGASSITDSHGDKWTLSNGDAFDSGIKRQNCAASTIILLLYFDNYIYEEGSNGVWWSWNGSAWVQDSCGDPRIGSGSTSSSGSGSVSSSSGSSSSSGTVTGSSSGSSVTNGACGSSNNGTFASAPTTNLCSAGTATTVTEDGNVWVWQCAGTGLGKVDACMASSQAASGSGSSSGGGNFLPDPGNIIWQSSFETGNLSEWVANQSCPNGATVVTSPVKAGTHAVKFSVADGDTNAKCAAVPTDNARAQLVGPSGLFKPGDDVYVGLSVYFPSDFPSIRGWFSFAELYGPPFGGSPTMELDVEGSTLSFGSHTTSTGYNTYWSSSTPIVKDAWTNIVMHVVWSTDPNVGEVQLWVNGMPETFTNGSTTIHYPTFDPSINGTSDTIFINQYREAGMGLGTITLYEDDIRVGRTYNSVAR